MKLIKSLLLISVFVLSLVSGSAFAQEGDDEDLDVTMTLMPEGAELPDAVTRELELPRDSEDDDEARGDRASGIAEGSETADAARSDGLAVAADNAAEAAAEALANAVEAAADNREELGRDGVPSGPLDQVPDLPRALPTDLPADPPSDLPADLPADLPMDLPGETPDEIPAASPPGGPGR